MNISDQATRPAFQIGHALTTLAMLFGLLGWVVAGDKEQDKDRAQVKREVTEVNTRQEMIIRQQDKMDAKLDKIIEKLGDK